MLQNEPIVAYIGFDTAENGPSKIWATNEPSDLFHPPGQIKSPEYGKESQSAVRDGEDTASQHVFDERTPLVGHVEEDLVRVRSLAAVFRKAREMRRVEVAYPNMPAEALVSQPLHVLPGSVDVAVEILPRASGGELVRVVKQSDSAL